MNKKPAILSAEVKYEFTRQEIEEMIKVYANLDDGVIEWDITSRGQVRGATIKVRRTEIKG